MFEVENVFRGVESKLQINEDVSIYIGQPREEFFYQYVCDYDSDFYEPLSVRVNLVAFAEKISRLSTMFVVVSSSHVAGIVASYFYDVESRKGFITLVHTKKEFSGKRLAYRLIDAVVHYAKMKNFLNVDLVVYRDNVAAFNLYLSSGFDLISDDGGRCTLRRVVK